MRIRNLCGDAIDEIAKRLRDERISTDGLRVEWRGFGTGILIPILESYVDFQEEIPEIDRRGLIHEAVYKAATDQDLDRDSILKRLGQAEKDYLQKPRRPFVLASSWTLAPLVVLKRLRVRDVGISFGSPHRVRVNRNAVQHLIDEVVPYPVPDMLQVRARLKARTASGAFEAGQYALDFARGLLNYLNNKRTAGKLFYNGQRPVNHILAGPVHTVHKPSGGLADHTVWYETSRIDKISAVIRGSLPKWEESAQKIRERLQRSFYSADIEHGFVRYTRALDTPDPAVAFGKLWTALEFLAGTSDQEKIVQRILRLTAKEDRRLVEIALRHLRDVRNGVVHIDEKRKLTDVRAGMEALVYQLKTFAEWLLKFHVRVCVRFESRSSALEALDVPLVADELRRRIKLYRRALKRSGS